MDIKIKGAKENNLKNIDVTIPKNKLIVFTGLSGSGKSTLALETLQRECQRQYMESMGMTMDIGSKPKVESIEGLSPAISINQHSTNNNPRSTVGTVTEISSYLRVLFAKLGERPCPHCHQRITQSYGVTEAADFSELPDQETQEAELFEQTISCPHCGKPVVELTASHFSFNKPQGACQECHGIGVVNSPDVKLLIDHSKSIREFAISGWDQVYIDRYGGSMVEAAKYYGFEMDIDTPVGNYTDLQRDLLLYGVLSHQFKKRFPEITPPKTVPEGRFEGVVTNLMRRYTENSSQSARQKIEKFLVSQECPVCHGIRFRSETLKVKVQEANIKEIMSMSLTSIKSWLDSLTTKVSPQAWEIVWQVVGDLKRKLERIIESGAGYLSLDQPAASLSAGEWQRIKLASVLGSGLTGVLYVLDEPTSGLHSQDTQKVIEVLKHLRDMGNTVIVIEHDLEIMKAADHIIDFGPGAGRNGGSIVASGSVPDIIQCEASITGKYLKNSQYQPKRKKLSGADGNISIKNASLHNLKKINVDIPLGRFVAVTGVSGSGKSSLIFGHLAESVQDYFLGSQKMNDPNVSGLDKLTGVVIINQQSIGRSNRSNAATYTDLFTDIRDLFASLPETKTRGLTAKHFSYNVAGGRCEKCQGSGKLSVSMHFLPDVEVICPVCRGKRYQRPVLESKYKGYNISDVLELSIDDAIELFAQEKNILTKLQILQDVGLGYLGLGQSTATLSGGEAQRLKLAKELATGSGGRNLYLFDEPTTGLHPHDSARLVTVFDRLVKLGNSVVVIEHNMEMILEADWVIDLGPEGGNEGGEIVTQGTPEEIMMNSNSHTGKILSEAISNSFYLK